MGEHTFRAFSEILQILQHMGPRGWCTARAGLAAGAGCPELIPPATRGQERGFELPELGPAAEPGSPIPVARSRTVPLPACRMVPCKVPQGFPGGAPRGAVAEHTGIQTTPCPHKCPCNTLSDTPVSCTLVQCSSVPPPVPPRFPMHPCLLQAAPGWEIMHPASTSTGTGCCDCSEPQPGCPGPAGKLAQGGGNPELFPCTAADLRLEMRCWGLVAPLPEGPF